MWAPQPPLPRPACSPPIPVSCVRPLAQGECSLHGRVRLVAPAGLDETIAEQLVGTLNRVVAAAEDHAAALGFGEHIKVSRG